MDERHLSWGRLRQIYVELQWCILQMKWNDFIHEQLSQWAEEATDLPLSIADCWHVLLARFMSADSDDTAFLSWKQPRGRKARLEKSWQSGTAWVGI